MLIKNLGATAYQVISKRNSYAHIKAEYLRIHITWLSKFFWFFFFFFLVPFVSHVHVCDKKKGGRKVNNCISRHFCGIHARSKLFFFFNADVSMIIKTRFIIKVIFRIRTTPGFGCQLISEGSSIFPDSAVENVWHWTRCDEFSSAAFDFYYTYQSGLYKWKTKTVYLRAWNLSWLSKSYLAKKKCFDYGFGVIIGFTDYYGFSEPIIQVCFVLFCLPFYWASQTLEKKTKQKNIFDWAFLFFSYQWTFRSYWILTIYKKMGLAERLCVFSL